MALLKVLRIIRTDCPEIHKCMWKYADWLWDGLTRAGFILTNSQTPINSIKSGNSVETLKLARWFYENGILTTPFIYPSVPEKEGRIRLIASANLKESSIDRVLDKVTDSQTVMA
jgi:glycine C-acetyltransferase